jgi:hypothetical protein
VALGSPIVITTALPSATRMESAAFLSPPIVLAAAEERTVTVRPLDSLLREELVPRADYIKLDCEGFEPEILKSARQYLASCDGLCVTAETNFHLSPVYPRTHFHAINEIMVDHRLLVFDINEVRSPEMAGSPCGGGAPTSYYSLSAACHKFYQRQRQAWSRSTDQCDISTGTVMCSRSSRLTPPINASRSCEW